MQKSEYSQTSKTLKTEKHDTEKPYLKVYYKLLECSFVLEFNIVRDPSTRFPKDPSWLVNYWQRSKSNPRHSLL